MKATLKVSTPAGEFTRTSATVYTHAVVWASPRAAWAVVRMARPDARRPSGVEARWIKDRGHGVTWHTGAAAARLAARSYKWDDKATLVGVFAVEVQ